MKIRIAFIIFILLSFINKSYCQFDETQIKVALIYQCSQNIQWQGENSFDKFRIAVYGNDRNMEKELMELSETVLLKSKEIEIIHIFNALEIKTYKPQVIYVAFDKLLELKSIYKTVYDQKSILIFTENSFNKEFIMINFISEENKINFEINTKTVKGQNLIMLPRLMLMGGKELDIKNLYLDKEKELKKEKIKTRKYLESIKLQEEKIFKQQSLIVIQKNDIDSQLIEINKQNDLLKKQDKGIIEQQELLLKQKDDISKQQIELLELYTETKTQKKLVKEKNQIISKNQDYIKIQEKEVYEKQDVLNELNFEIENQRGKLKDQNVLIKSQKQGLLMSFIFSFLVIILVIFIFRAYSVKRKNIKLLREKNDIINGKNEELQMLAEELRTNADELDNRNFELSKKNKNITDSINYAGRIQNSLLPEKNIFSTNFSDHFILYRPRDIVSGDFYWAKKILDNTVIAVADCTGHGVPGAFMSMLGISFLNEIVNKTRFDDAGKILDRLRRKVKKSLKQTGKKTEQKDGIDIALFIINTNSMTLQYAGANSPLLFIRNNIPEILKPNRMPIGIHGREKPFSNLKKNLEKGDIIYAYSDGYQDQFGGKHGRKFFSLRFKELLFDIHEKSMNEQKSILETTMKKWQTPQKRINNPYRQVDDILVMGLKI